MKRFLALLLASVMLLAVAGCKTTEKPPARPTEASGQLILGNTTELNGDWGEAQWKNNAADKDIRTMTTGYETISQNPAGDLFYNPTVVEKHESVENADGTKTFTITIKQGLKFSDGTAITAEQYVGYVLLFTHPAAIAMGANGTAGYDFTGYDAYRDGTSNVFSGVRLIDEYTFSLEVIADNIPYFYDMIYTSLIPLQLHIYLPEGYSIKDDGQGCYIDGEMMAGDSPVEAVQKSIEAGRFMSEGRPCSGPYMIESFDVSAKEVVLTINPNFVGDYEGKKPLIAKIVYTLSEQATQIDALKTGAVDILLQLARGEDIKAGLDLVEEGGFEFSKYLRSGYGMIRFVCDFGPTQYAEVRQGIAHLLDRADFASAFTGGYGGVVNGPYGMASWMYQEAEDDLDKKLNKYPYSVDDAIECFEAAGFTLGEDGKDYSGTGIRYKEVDASNEYLFNKVVDGKTLMPLILNWLSTENNAVSDLLVTKLQEGTAVAQAGAEIKSTFVTFDELMLYMERDASMGDQYGVPTYSMYNLASNFTIIYDQMRYYSTDPQFYGSWNTTLIKDEQLESLSYDMVYGVQPGDKAKFLEKWTPFIVRWNEMLPELPLYSNEYHDVYNAKLKGYNPTPYWNICDALCEVWIEG